MKRIMLLMLPLAVLACGTSKKTTSTKKTTDEETMQEVLSSTPVYAPPPPPPIVREGAPGRTRDVTGVKEVKQLHDFSEGVTSKSSFGKNGEYDLVTNTIRKDGSTNSYYGISEKNGKVVLPAVFYSIRELPNGDVSVRLGRSTGLFSSDFKQIIPIEYENVSPLGTKSLYLVDRLNSDYDNARRLIDNNDKDILGDNYQNITIPSSLNKDYSYSDYSTVNYLMVKSKSNNKYGIYDIKNGRMAVPAKYDQIENAGDGQILVKEGTTYNVLRNFSPVFKMNMAEIKYYDAGLYLVNTGSKWGVADNSGEFVVPAVYNSVNYVRGKLPLFIVSQSPGKYSVITDKSKALFSDYDTIINVNDVHFILKRNKKWGLMDILGTEVLPLSYDTIYSDGYRRVFAKKGTITLVNLTDGRVEATPTPYEDIETLSYSSAYKVRKGNLYGILNSNLQKETELEYESITRESRAYDNYSYWVQKNGKKGILSSRWETHLPIKYDQILYFSSIPAFVVKLNNKYGIVDLYNNEIEPVKYDYIGTYSGDDKSFICVAGTDAKIVKVTR